MQRRKLIKGILAATPALWLGKYAGAMPFAGAPVLKMSQWQQGLLNQTGNL